MPLMVYDAFQTFAKSDFILKDIIAKIIIICHEIHT